MKRRHYAIRYAQAKAMRRDAILNQMAETALCLTLYIQALRRAWRALR